MNLQRLPPSKKLLAKQSRSRHLPTRHLFNQLHYRLPVGPSLHQERWEAYSPQHRGVKVALSHLCAPPVLGWCGGTEALEGYARFSSTCTVA